MSQRPSRHRNHRRAPEAEPTARPRRRGATFALGLALAGLSLGIGAAVVEAAVARGEAPSWMAAVTGGEEAESEAPARGAARPAEGGTAKRAATEPAPAETPPADPKPPGRAQPDSPTFASTRAPEPDAPRAPAEPSEPEPDKAKPTTTKPAQEPAAKTPTPEGDEEPVHREQLAERAGEDAPPDLSTASPEPGGEPATQQPERAEHEPRTLDGLMAGALPEEPSEAEPEPEPAPAERRLTPTRREVVDALENIRPRIRECAAGEHGLAKIDVTFGSSGRVRVALVDGAFAGSRAGSCMAKAVRSIELEPFDEARFEVRYPFRL